MFNYILIRFIYMCHILYCGPFREHTITVYYKSYWALLPVYTIAIFSLYLNIFNVTNYVLFVTVNIFNVSTFETKPVMYPSWPLPKTQDESCFVAFLCLQVLNECSRRDGLSCWPSEMLPWGNCWLACLTSCLIWSFVVFWLWSVKLV